MKLKRLTTLLLSAAMLLSLTACGGKSSSTAAGDGEASVSASENTSASSGDADKASLERSDPMNITTTTELTAKMKIGWNLGNTLDANGSGGINSETSWGNPITTKEMIDEVSNAGFNVIRVPVSWGKHMDDDWVIDPAWLDRVQEVVNYGYDNGMYVILNTHHEEWYLPYENRAEQDMEKLGKLWEQIAERFKDYGERLLFEGINEPRLRDDPALEWGGNDEAREVINRYEQKFVDTVRASGGNNEKRALLITPYAASSNPDNLKALKVPENAGNFIISVHAYLPYGFALDTNGTATYKNDGSISSLAKKLKKLYLDEGYAVILTEFGCVNKNNSEERIKNITDFLNHANEIGVPCVWWDNGYNSGSGETFGLLNRKQGGWYNPEIKDKLIELTKDRG